MQTTALIADSLLNGNEILMWLGVLTAFFMFHCLLNVLIGKQNSTSETGRNRA